MRFPHDVEVRYRELVTTTGSQDRHGWNRARYQREAGMLRRSAAEIQDHLLRRQLLQIACAYERLARDDKPSPRTHDTCVDVGRPIIRLPELRHT